MKIASMALTAAMMLAVLNPNAIPPARKRLTAPTQPRAMKRHLSDPKPKKRTRR